LAAAGIAIANFARAGFVLANMGEVGVPRSRVPRLAALKAAGAAGLLLGLLGAWPIGSIAAAAGLVLFFTGAIAAHVRARMFHNIAFPGAYFALAAASGVLAAAVH
jgi:DoxX-like family